MNEQEIRNAKGQLAELNQQDQRIRLGLEELEAASAERQGQLQVLQAEYRERLEALKQECEQRIRSVSEDAESIAKERLLLLASRRDAKNRYGILYEQVGRAERALEAAEAEQTEGD